MQESESDRHLLEAVDSRHFSGRPLQRHLSAIKSRDRGPIDV